MSISMKEYRLPEPLVAFLKLCRLHGVPEMTTGLQHQRVTVSLAWDLSTPAPTRPKKTVQPPSARHQQEPPLRQTSSPQPTTINVPTATIVFGRQEKTATPAPKPTDTVTRPAPKPAPAEKKTCALARSRGRRPIDATTTPSISDGYINQRPAPGDYSRRYQ